MKARHIFMTILLAVVSLTASAQNRVTVTGNVTDQNGEPLIGATVRIPGMKGGTVTDIDGNFTVSVPEGTKALQIDYVGYKSQTVNIKKGKASAALKEDTNIMDEVVVIGYGAVKRGDVTNAVAKVKGEDLEDRPVSNLASAMQGELAGVEIRNETGMPGGKVSINVRGNTSINEDYDASPLYVVDGIPMDDDFDLGTLNAQDIKSIDVLKDASSSAIYGSRGANGVILVTTKGGNEDGKTTITVGANFSLSSMMDKVDVFTAAEWVRFASMIIDNRYVTDKGYIGASADDDYAARVALIGSADSNRTKDPRWDMPGLGGLAQIDWQDEMYRTALMQKYDISISSGNKKSNYRASVGYINQDGIAICTNYKRINAMLKAQSTLKDRLTVGINLNAQFGATKGGSLDGSNGTAGTALNTPPIAEPEAGIYTGADPYRSYNWSNSNVSPVAQMERNYDRKENLRVTASAFARYNIMSGLDAEVTGSWLFTDADSKRFLNSGVRSSWYNYSHEGKNSQSTWSASRQQKYLGQALLTYINTFGKHSINAVAGWSIESTSHSTKYRIQLKDFPNNALMGFDLSKAAYELEGLSGTFNTDVRLVSYFARAEYGYDNRYLINASIRRDGSSKFGLNNHWGTFPAISAAWRASNEKFWNKDWIVNGAKLRVSYGVNGSNSIPANAARGLMGVSSWSDTSGASLAGYAPISTDNTTLGWQKTDSWNLGVDLGLFNNRISMAIDFYRKDIRDMLYSMTVPAILGYTSAYNNVGNIRNEGIEVELKTENLTGRLRWTTNLTLGYNHNKVVSLGSNSTIYKEQNNRIIEVFEVGRPAGEFYLYKAIGVFQTQEDLDNYPKQDGAQVGDIMYSDRNKDGKIDSEDRYYMGSPRPAVTYGLKNAFRYKNWDFSFLFTAQTGGKIYSLLGRKIDNPQLVYTNNRMPKWMDLWISESHPGNGIIPRAGNSVGNIEGGDDRWLYSSDYLKLQNITLGYRLRFPKSWFASQLRITASVENVFMIDKYDGGYSPEARNSTGLLNYDGGSYPLARTFALGLNVTF